MKTKVVQTEAIEFSVSTLYRLMCLLPERIDDEQDM